MEMRVMGKKSNALGRGLGTIIQDHSANIENVISKGENGQGLSIMKIPLDLIDPNPFQPRHNFNEEEIGELAQTIKEHGLIQPITVRKFNGRYQIVRMYRAKSQGKGHIMFFNEEMQQAIENRMEIETQLHSAIENKELFLEYQPQYNSTTHQLCGFEALCRWASPTLGHVCPADFIPIAEETGDIVAMGKWIMETACTQYMAVYDQYETPPILAINISAMQLRDADFLDSVKRIIKTTNMDTDHLELEITESVCIMAPEIISGIFGQLKNMGVAVAMDDFGTGYSSLSYLRNLPLDIVKIDITFTRTILTTPPEKNLIKTIITMAHQLGLKVIAEGVEQQKQLNYLIENGCD